ncbi:MAG: 7TM diverse intracellular signaling domain-containing protein, partial [SAR324 cluster bacterium]|nr:7TM diverse intracellular signaling domain-containing protein [SAR324 cluster bacterium]
MLIFCGSSTLFAQNAQFEVETQGKIKLNSYLSHFADATTKLSMEEARAKSFTPLHADPKALLYSFGFTDQAHWFKFNFKTGAVQGNYLLQQGFWRIQQFDLWLFEEGNPVIKHVKSGGLLKFDERPHTDNSLVLPIEIKPFRKYQVLIRTESFQITDIQLILWKEKDFDVAKSREILLNGVYYGGLFLMLLYHLMLTFYVRDKAYLYYSLYLGNLLMSMTVLNGHGFQYFWPNYPIQNAWAFPLIRCFGLIWIILFITEVLKVKERQPKLFAYFKSAIAINLLILVTFTLFSLQVTQFLITFNSIFCLALFFVAAIRIYKAGHREALFISSALAVYLVSLFIMLSRFIGLIPNVHFGLGTAQIVMFADVVFFSIALAERIKNLRRDRYAAQVALVEESKRNSEELKDKVDERTHLLQEALSEVELNHEQLISTQMLMIQTEKMAGLGTLVAGVAHEINNPSSAVHLNAYNLKADLRELQETLFELAEDDTEAEVIQLLEKKFENIKAKLVHIEDGSSRIKSIVEDLRTFSRLDEAGKKEIDVVSNVASTQRLIQAQWGDQVTFIQDFKDSPQFECWPAQLNQVFMNILVNGCQAIAATGEKGSLTATSEIQGDHLVLAFKDTGCGMEQETLQKMFDPFFTT